VGRFLRFCWGFWGKLVVEGGFLMVNLWWDRGRLWRFDGHYLGLKTRHVAWIYFSKDPVLGIG